jgi:hypothetical protein
MVASTTIRLARGKQTLRLHGHDPSVAVQGIVLTPK